MKIKESSSLVANFPPIKLYRNDLDQILSRLTVCKSIVLSDDLHEFESLDEIKAHWGSYIKKIIIEGKSPYIRISIGTERFFGSNVYLSMMGASDETKYLFHDLKDFLKQKVRWISRIHIGFPLLFAMTFSGFFALSLNYWYSESTRIYANILADLFLLFSIIYLGLTLTHISVSSSIFLDFKHNINFWHVNKDKVIVNLIMVMLGIVGTLLAQYIIRKFF